MNWDSIGMAATAAFAVTAVLAIRADNELDLIGAMVLGLITAIGGGTLRDLILDVPVFWKDHLAYVWVATAASVAAFYGRRLFSARHVYRLMLYLDGFGVAMFSIQAETKVWDLDFGVPAAPVMLGVITAIGGGLMRDVLASRTTLLLRPELYATPVLLGCIAYAVVLAYLPAHRPVASVVCIASIFAMRAAAIHWNLSVPSFARLPRAGA